MAESPVRARGPSSRSDAETVSELYLQELEAFNRNWLTWRSNWYVIGTRATREVDMVVLTPDGLRVHLLGLNVVFTLPIGPSQVFESWAWLVEVMYRVDIGKESAWEISRLPEELIYTWPVFALAQRRGTDVSQVELYEAAIELIPHLFACLFFDRRVMDAEGKAIPSEFREIANDLASRGVTTGRLYWQLVRDQPHVARDTDTAASLDRYLMSIGLPALSSVVAATSAMVERTRSAFETALEEMEVEAASRGGVAETTHVFVELALLRTSTHNLNELAGHLDIALNAPLLLMPRFEPPICAIECGTYYQWMVAAYYERSSDALRHQRGRVMLGQQWAMYEHIVEQFVFGSHVGCYGSPQWRLPLNACPAAEACLALAERHGIEFCVDADWRQKVASVLSPVFATSGETVADTDLPGISAALHEYELRLRKAGSRGESNDDFAAFVAGLVRREK